MKELVEVLAKKKVLLFNGGLFILLCMLSNTIWRQTFTYLTQTFNYTPDYAIELLSTIGPNGRLAHTYILIADFFMVIIYCAFLIGMNYRLSCKVTNSCHWITGLTFSPLLLGIVQFVEILFVYLILANYPNNHRGFIQITSVVTSVKTVLTPICFLLPIILGLILLIKTISRRSYGTKHTNLNESME